MDVRGGDAAEQLGHRLGDGDRALALACVILVAYYRLTTGVRAAFGGEVR